MSAIAVTLALVSMAMPAAASDVGPIQKVLQLLSDMEAKITKEGAASNKNHEDFTAWCKERSANLGYEIKTGQAEVADLNAAIEHAAASVEKHTSEIEAATASIAASEADLKAGTEVRAKEQADFEAEEHNTVDVISALERAINVLEREARKGGAAMVQIQKASDVLQALSVMVDASLLRSQDAKALTVLVQNSQQDSGSPDGAVYQSHSGSIIDTLSDLLDKARSQLEDARHKETAATHNFEMLKQSLQDSIAYTTDDLAAAKNNRAAQKGVKSGAEGDLAVTSKTLAENQKMAASLAQDCETKHEAYEAEVKSRAEELAALAEAKKVISETTDGAKAITYSEAQTSFLQLVQSTLRTSADLANFEVVQFVRKLAKEQNSDTLAQLGRRIASTIHAGSATGENPFAKVKGLIAALIARLEGEGQADAKHKAYCDKETAHTLYKKGKRDAEIEKLNVQIDTMEARSATLKEQVAALEKALADLAATQAEMNKLRLNEHAQYLEDKSEMELGISGIKSALKVLREYYAVEDKAHEEAGDAASGVIGLLEVIESDFTKTLAETNAAETAAQAAHEQATKENEIETTMKQQDAKFKNQEIGQLAKALAEASSDHESTSAELSAILEYKAKLDEMCVPKAETYASRKAKREAEIAGLQEALTILESEAALLQRKDSTRRQRGFLME